MNDKIDNLLQERGKQWGDPTRTHERIAQIWDAIVNGEKITALKVALMMDGLKTIRADINPAEVDSFDDKGGYTEIARHIAGHPSSFTKAASKPVQDPLPEAPAPIVDNGGEIFQDGRNYLTGTAIHLATKIDVYRTSAYGIIACGSEWSKFFTKNKALVTCRNCKGTREFQA